MSPTRITKHLNSLKSNTSCAGCRASKIRRHDTKAAFVTRVTRSLERVSADTLYLGNSNYIVIIDNFSSHDWVDPVPNKASIPARMIKYFNRMAQRFPHYPIANFMSDNGSEFFNQTLQNYLQEKGIQQISIPTHSPVINSKVGRVNRTLIEGTRSMVITSQAPPEFIPHVVRHLCEWHNLLPQRHLKQSPHEILYGSSLISSDLFHPFGCRINFQISTHTRGGTSKVEPIARTGIYLGFYLDQVICYIIYDPIDHKIVHTTHVFFDDNVKGFAEQIALEEVLKMTAIFRKDPPQEITRWSIHQVETLEHAEPQQDIIPRNPTTRHVIRYPEWTDAMISEFKNHEYFGTFQVVPRPRNTQLIPLSWVLSTKTLLDGSVEIQGSTGCSG